MWLLAAIFVPNDSQQELPTGPAGSNSWQPPAFPQSQSPAPGSSSTSSVPTFPAGFNQPSNPPSTPGTFNAPLVIYGQKIINSFEARCVGVSDGDTLTALTADNIQVKIRLASIDAPESKQAYGSVAKQALSEMCYGKTLGIYQTGSDRYQRMIAFVGVNGTNINAEMIRYGLAWHYRQYSNSAELQQLEDLARAWRTGLWAEANPVYPEEFRKLR